ELWDTYRHRIPGAENEPPFAALVYPYDGRSVSGNVTLSATAYGIHGIDSVQFKVNGNDLGSPVTDTLNETPYAYQYSWDTTQFANGNYQITVTAVDRRDNTYESRIVELTVNN
ncbi:MAG: Ig-like domain-containing protein, partial [Halanaerobiales bacterium]